MISGVIYLLSQTTILHKYNLIMQFNKKKGNTAAKNINYTKKLKLSTMDVSMDMHSNTCRFISIFISVDFMKNEPSSYELKLSFIYNL